MSSSALINPFPIILRKRSFSPLPVLAKPPEPLALTQSCISTEGSDELLLRPKGPEAKPSETISTARICCNDPQKLKYIIEALSACHQAGFDVGDVKIAALPKTDRYLHTQKEYGHYDPKLDLIILRHNVDWDELVLEAHQKYPQWINKTYTGSPAHLVLHELGHYLHYHENPALFEKLRDTKIPPTLKTKILEELGHEYPTKNANEAVAEMFAGIMGGKRYSDELLMLYQACGGPLPQKKAK